MIVTRRRKKPFPWKVVVIAAIIVAAAGAALSWPPSYNYIAKGPLEPVLRPFHFAAQNQIIVARNHQVAQLQQQLKDAQDTAQSKDKQITDMQSQMNRLATQNTQPRTSAVQRVSPVPPSDLASSATPEMRRTAQYWASMDPENAAKVVEKLPIGYVVHVFAVMSPDAVGAVLDALPPAYAAQLTQEHPELRK